MYQNLSLLFFINILHFRCWNVCHIHSHGWKISQARRTTKSLRYHPRLSPVIRHTHPAYSQKCFPGKRKCIFRHTNITARRRYLLVTCMLVCGWSFWKQNFCTIYYSIQIMIIVSYFCWMLWVCISLLYVHILIFCWIYNITVRGNQVLRVDNGKLYHIFGV